MAALVKNNATGVLASGIASGATSLTLQSGQGARFPSPTGSEYFWATLIDASNNIEIVKCTAVSTDTLTITRAQQGTTARAYSAGDRCEMRITSAHLDEKLSLSGGDLTKEGNPAYFLKNITVLTSGTNATYTTPTGVRALKVTAVGGGGGGGGADGAGASTYAASSAGAGGGWAEALITSVAASYTYTVGAAGAGAAAGNFNGAAGSTSEFKNAGATVVISATGGAGGLGDLGAASAGSSGVMGGIGSLTGVTGIVAAGVSSNYSRVSSSTYVSFSQSGGSKFGGGQVPLQPGGAARVYGEGGGATYAGAVTTNYAGGNGYQGVIIIEEYY